MQAIVAVDLNYAIGNKGQMLYHLPDDLKHFARITRGKTLVMGRATLESLPGGKPLKDRVNIVLTRNRDYQAEGAVVLHSTQELAEYIADIPQDDVMLIGGDSLYHELIDCCDKAYVTKIDAVAQADSFFPNLDDKANWELVSCSPTQEQNGLHFSYCEYVNQMVEPLL